MQTNEQVLAAAWGQIFAAGLISPAVSGGINGDRARAVKVAADWADLGTAELLARMKDASLGGPGGLVKHLEKLPK